MTTQEGAYIAAIVQAFRDDLKAISDQGQSNTQNLERITQDLNAVKATVDVLSFGVRRLDGKHDELSSDVRRLEAKNDEFQRTVGDRFDEVDARFDAVGARFDAVSARFDAVSERFDAVGERLDAVGERLDRVEAQLGSNGIHDRRTASRPRTPASRKKRSR